MPADLSVTSPAIWIIPYAQLKATARMAWTRSNPDRVIPQITTIRDWATSLGVVAKATTDIHFDIGIDRLIAESLLKRSGLETAPAFVQRLLDMTYEAAPTLAAMHPSSRVVWASARAGLFQQGGQFQLEGAIGFAALMWAAATNYDTDVLWERRAALLKSTEHFYVTTGLQQDALVQTILDGASSKVTVIDLGALGEEGVDSINEYIASDFEDLVQQTAAVILASPAKTMALIALDRQLTRRLSAVLANRGIALIDETGWALSTTTVAAQLMAWLEAMAFDATSDVVLAALKSAPVRFLPIDVSKQEQKIRRESQVAWSHTGCDLLGDWPARFAKPRPLKAWLLETQELLELVGLWDAMQTDLAGQALLQALHLGSITPSVLSNFAAPMPRGSFVAWVRAVLEANRFRLKFEARNEESDTVTVTTLPLAQMWGRHFDAVVVPSCDDRRLPARPRTQSDWSAAQREALSLPTADEAAAAQSKAWAWLCSQSNVILLWQQMEGNELLPKSSLLQVLEMEGRLARQNSPLVMSQSTSMDLGRTDHPDVFQQGVSIDWQILAPAQLSASAYADLRACPYRFYATRILGLRDSDELDEQVDKRDFGNWLHGTLYRFHEALKHEPTLDYVVTINACAATEQASLGLDDAAFLPFALIWPKTREAYLSWLGRHEASGARYEAGEVKQSFPISVEGKTVNLVGTLDRIDKDSVLGERWLLDYKTEALQKTRDRINKNADEDTQLAFYAALVSNDSPQSDSPIRAAYINLVERANGKTGKDATSTNELVDLETRRDDLLDGIWVDLSNMAAGHVLRALGEGEACTYCQVRGLCRRDFV